MRTPPVITAETIAAGLRDGFGVEAAGIAFLPIGADVHTAVYRVSAGDGATHFLKLRSAGFDEVSVAVPFLLREQGIGAVMAPVASTSGRMWVERGGFSWILYPFIEARTGYQARLSAAQWVVLGQTLRAVHGVALPAALERRVPREDYSPRWRQKVEACGRRIEGGVGDDPLAQEFAAFWHDRRGEIEAIVERSGRLGQGLRRRAPAPVLCHGDLHPGNVLVGAGGDLAVVDWDDLIFAPPERDLMCVGGGLGFVGEGAREAALFHRGYGPTEVDPAGLAYYRYERIVADLADYAVQFLGPKGSVEDRAEGLRQLARAFRPGGVVDAAHRTYGELAG